MRKNIIFILGCTLIGVSGCCSYKSCECDEKTPEHVNHQGATAKNDAAFSSSPLIPVPEMPPVAPGFQNPAAANPFPVTAPQGDLYAPQNPDSPQTAPL